MAPCKPKKVPGIHNVKSINYGKFHCAAVTHDGSLWTWGTNYNHCLGYDGRDTNEDGYDCSIKPSKVPDISNVISASVGGQATAAVTSDGLLWTWGGNYYGNLGHDAREVDVFGEVCSKTPQRVPLSNVIAISCGDHCAAITSNGSLWTWGRNEYGELGYDAREINYHENGFCSKTPRIVPGISNVRAVSLGTNRTAAITSDGSLWTWGETRYGELGHDACDQGEFCVKNPHKVEGLSNVIAVSFGFGHCAAITSDGSLWTWGSNDYGELGHESNDRGWGSTTCSKKPQKVPGLSNVIAVSLGFHTSAAITSDGQLWTWGDNGDGQLAHESSEYNFYGKIWSKDPQQVPEISNATSVSITGRGGAVITSDGSIWTWGQNDRITLGY